MSDEKLADLEALAECARSYAFGLGDGLLGLKKGPAPPSYYTAGWRAGTDARESILTAAREQQPARGETSVPDGVPAGRGDVETQAMDALADHHWETAFPNTEITEGLVRVELTREEAEAMLMGLDSAPWTDAVSTTFAKITAALGEADG